MVGKTCSGFLNLLKLLLKEYYRHLCNFTLLFTSTYICQQIFALNSKRWILNNLVTRPSLKLHINQYLSTNYTPQRTSTIQPRTDCGIIISCSPCDQSLTRFSYWLKSWQITRCKTFHGIAGRDGRVARRLKDFGRFSKRLRRRSDFTLARTIIIVRRVPARKQWKLDSCVNGRQKWDSFARG